MQRNDKPLTNYDRAHDDESHNGLQSSGKELLLIFGRAVGFWEASKSERRDEYCADAHLPCSMDCGSEDLTERKIDISRDLEAYGA